jgi:uncharacterized protein (TIGR03435 family)
MRAIAITLALALAQSSAPSQAAQFEVASVRPSSGGVSPGLGLHIDGSQVRITNLSLKTYVGLAFGLRPQQIEGPDWLGQPRFDVAAKMPDGASPDQAPAMLRALLADRFHMTSHRETRQLPVFALTVAKEGFALHPVAEKADPSAADDRPGVNVTAGGGGADLGRGASFTVADNHVEIHRMTLRSIADLLTRLSDRPVIDMTGITGMFDLTLDLAPEDFVAAQIRAALNSGMIVSPQALRMVDNGRRDSFANALRNVGLALESRKAPLDVLVIDSIEKTPTEN